MGHPITYSGGRKLEEAWVERDTSGSFDCAGHDETVTRSAQDDEFLGWRDEGFADGWGYLRSDEFDGA